MHHRPLAAALVCQLFSAASAGILFATRGVVATAIALGLFGLALGAGLAWTETTRGRLRVATSGLLLFGALGMCALGGLAIDAARPAPPIVFIGNDGARAALAAARRDHEPVVLDFGATWCWPTFRFDGDTPGHDAVRRASRDFVMIHVDMSDEGEPIGQALATQYRMLGVPQILVLDGDGEEAARIDMYAEDPQVVLRALDEAKPR